VSDTSDSSEFDPHTPTDRTAQAFDVVQDLLSAFLRGGEPDFAAVAMGDVTERLLRDQQLLWETFLYLGWAGSVAVIEVAKCRNLDVDLVAARLVRELRRQVTGEGDAWGSGAP
jgi:hypothetical protein